jgi:hypothetical protein
MSHDIAVDDSGNAYATGRTYSSDFPITEGALDDTIQGSADVFVTKINPVGTALEYSTFLGGSDYDIGRGIAVDDDGKVHLTGSTGSPDFPVTPSAFDTMYASGEAFFVKLSTVGDALEYATLLGGDGGDGAYGIVMEDTDICFLVGTTGSVDFPTTPGAYATEMDTSGGLFQDGFVCKFDIRDKIAPDAISDLSIALENGAKSSSGDMRLAWSEPYDNVGVVRYVIYRDTTVGSSGDSLNETGDTTYLDVGAAGTVGTNYFYTVKAVDAAGNKSGESNKVGEFDRDLIAAP